MLSTNGSLAMCFAVSLLLGVPPVPAAQVQVNIVCVVCGAWCLPLEPAFLLGFWGGQPHLMLVGWDARGSNKHCDAMAPTVTPWHLCAVAVPSCDATATLGWRPTHPSF